MAHVEPSKTTPKTRNVFDGQKRFRAPLQGTVPLLERSIGDIFLSGGDPSAINGMTLEVVDAIIAADSEAETQIQSR
jgi:hypothetical protein